MAELLRMKRELSKENFSRMKRKFGEEDKNRLYGFHVVSSDERANWLIDYWCGKDIRGLIQMSFSRHWIMHVEASLRIDSKLRNKSKWRSHYCILSDS